MHKAQPALVQAISTAEPPLAEARSQRARPAPSTLPTGAPARTLATAQWLGNVNDGLAKRTPFYAASVICCLRPCARRRAISRFQPVNLPRPAATGSASGYNPPILPTTRANRKTGASLKSSLAARIAFVAAQRTPRESRLPSSGDGVLAGAGRERNAMASEHDIDYSLSRVPDEAKQPFWRVLFIRIGAICCVSQLMLLSLIHI